MERIAVIIGKMHSGGKKNLIMEYYRHIDRSIVQFDFFCDADSNSIPKDEIESLGGRIYVIEPYQKILRNIKDIVYLCKKNDYKIIHGYNGTMNIFAMFAAWFAGVPIRINESISMSHNADKKNILKKILKPFSRCFSTHYLSNGEMCGRWQFGDKLFEKGKVTVFKTIINTMENGFNEEVRSKCRKKYKLDGKIVVGHIGRLTEQKNTLFLIDVFSEISKAESEAILLIIGDGNLRNEMLKKIKKLGLTEKVLYLGRREDIQQFYNAMDCFLLPSLYEGLPVVGVEAETSGLPVFFSTEIPRESCVSKDISYFIDLNRKPDEWAKVILTNTKENMIKRCSRTEEAKKRGFDSHKEAKKLVSYYEMLISSI